MKEFVDIRISPDQIQDEKVIHKKITNKLPKGKSAKDCTLVKRSIDARKQPVFQLRYSTTTQKDVIVEKDRLRPVHDAQPVHIIGAGPAGLYSALECICAGLKPIILERGKDVQSRRRDLKAIQQDGSVDPDSNYCFGEGGAGTYSDGKLYTRSHKRGSIISVLRWLVEHGASKDILIDAHPHIGSNKLPKIIAAMRETILESGGEIYFESRVEDIHFEDGAVRAVSLVDGPNISVEHLVLATGHSARDIYTILERQNIRMEAKAFAIGVRIGHPQPLIDEIQYGQYPRHEHLPASSYKLVTQVEDRGVFSFCMCPGGLIVPAATAPEELVVNGMSLSRRDSPYANSGIVVAVEPEDLTDDLNDVFIGIRFQHDVEQIFFEHGDGTQNAPAQRLTDFLRGQDSVTLPETSYIPGIHSARMDELLPEWIAVYLKRAFMDFGTKMEGYITSDAVIVGTESRTSSPVRIPRDVKSLMHPDYDGFYPCGEGAGYAGGIVSAAMDGQRVARAIAEKIKNRG